MQSKQFNSIRAFIIDMDGVLFRGQTRLPGARTFLETLQRESVPYVLLTNNSTLTAGQYVDKLNRMDIEVPHDRIMTSAIATAKYLAGQTKPGTRMYMIGMDGLAEALRAEGFVLTDKAPEYVVVGLDTNVTYRELCIASLAIRAGASFVGTNPDLTLPTERGLEPGAGAILSAIEAATEVQPKIIGKPQPGAFETALTMLGTMPYETAMIGDRLQTDIVGGASAGLRTLLVLTGATSPDDLAGTGVELDMVFDNLEQVVSTWSGD